MHLALKSGGVCDHRIPAIQIACRTHNSYLGVLIHLCSAPHGIPVGSQCSHTSFAKTTALPGHVCVDANSLCRQVKHKRSAPSCLVEIVVCCSTEVPSASHSHKATHTRTRVRPTYPYHLLFFFGFIIHYKFVGASLMILPHFLLHLSCQQLPVQPISCIILDPL